MQSVKIAWRLTKIFRSQTERIAPDLPVALLLANSKVQLTYMLQSLKHPPGSFIFLKTQETDGKHRLQNITLSGKTFNN